MPVACNCALITLGRFRLEFRVRFRFRFRFRVSVSERVRVGVTIRFNPRVCKNMRDCSYVG